MITTYNIDNITGGLDIMFKNMMTIGFSISIILLTIWTIISLLVWLFRSQKEIRNGNKIWNKKFCNNSSINYFYINSTNIV